MAENAPTLRERIAAITGEVKVDATGKTERGQRTISIGDVDAALGPLMAKHGVVSDYEFIDEPVVAYEMPTRNEGTLRMWKVHIRGIVARADCRNEIAEAADKESDPPIARELWDIGSSPSGAVSFALKRWLRALFKLAEDDDQVDSENQARAQANAGPQNDSRADFFCGKCGTFGHIRRLKAPQGDKIAFCAKGDGGCGAYLTKEQVKQRVTEPPPADESDSPPADEQKAEAAP